jgi:hypothetical protein
LHCGINGQLAALPRIAVWCGSNLPAALISRVLPSEGRGSEFESCRVRHLWQPNQWIEAINSLLRLINGVSEAPRKNRDGSRPFFARARPCFRGPCPEGSSRPEPPRARARGAIPCPLPRPPPDRRARGPRPNARGPDREAQRGFGSHLARSRDRGRAFPPPGALGPIGHAGGPAQRLIPAL